MEMEHVVIIGAGPAGISAALYTARGNLDPLVIHTGIGALEKAEKIENVHVDYEITNLREVYRILS